MCVMGDDNMVKRMYITVPKKLSKPPKWLIDGKELDENRGYEYQIEGTKEIKDSDIKDLLKLTWVLADPVPNSFGSCFPQAEQIICYP